MRNSLDQIRASHRFWAMNRAFTAVIKHEGKWWIGWVQEIPGVNSQGRTRKELVDNLTLALREALEFNRPA